MARILQPSLHPNPRAALAVKEIMRNARLPFPQRTGLLACAGLVLLLLAVAPAEMDDFLLWATGRKLTPTDFKGRPDLSSGMKAVTHSGIVYTWECDRDEFKFEVLARFDREKSWFAAAGDARLLKHEQLHFDITEVYARRMRKLFTEWPDPCSQTRKIDDAADAVYDEWSRTQELYDEETRHSLNREKQAEWEARISRELEELAQYAVE